LGRRTAELEGQLERIAEPLLREEVAEHVAYRRAIAEDRPLARVEAPDETYADRFRLPGERAATLVEGAGHSESDTGLHVPSGDVLFTGDLVSVGYHADLSSSDLGRWRIALDRLGRAGVGTLVPGHGRIAGPGDLDALRRYLDAVERTAAADGRPGVPAEFAGWKLPSLWESNLAALRARVR
jgi:glyoxylase-like metal-dependent hydrolase (beta-lactamase superfamily II)